MIPMLVGSRFRRAPAKTAKRSKVWVGSVSASAEALPPSNARVFTLINEANLETQGKPTIARIRGTWNAYPDIGSAPAASSMFCFVGITLVSTRALTQGINSVPLPSDNIEWPWMFWDVATVGVEVAATATGAPVDITRNNRVLDTKAMRKCPPAHTLILVVQTSVALDGAPDSLFTFATRILLMLS